MVRFITGPALPQYIHSGDLTSRLIEVPLKIVEKSNRLILYSSSSEHFEYLQGWNKLYLYLPHWYKDSSGLCQPEKQSKQFASWSVTGICNRTYKNGFFWFQKTYLWCGQGCVHLVEQAFGLQCWSCVLSIGTSAICQAIAGWWLLLYCYNALQPECEQAQLKDDISLCLFSLDISVPQLSSTLIYKVKIEFYVSCVWSQWSKVPTLLI